MLTELWKDTQCILAPATAQDMHGALQKLRIAPILNGYRGKPAANIESLVSAILTLQQHVVGSNLAEVELNPVLVTTTSSVAVDALIIEEK